MILYNQIDTTKTVYTFIKKCMVSFAYLSFFALVFTSLLAIIHLLFGSAENSPLLTGTLDSVETMSSLVVPIALMSTVYSAFSTPIELLTRRIAPGKKALRTYVGILKTREKVIPYNRIRSIELEQGPVQSILRFCRVKIDYGSWNDENLDVMSERKAKKLMRYIATRSTQARIYTDGIPV